MNAFQIGIVVIGWVLAVSCVVAACAAAGRADRVDARLRRPSRALSPRR